MIRSNAIYCDSGIKNVGQKISVMSVCVYITKVTSQKLASKQIFMFSRVVRMPVKKLPVSSYLWKWFIFNGNILNNESLSELGISKGIFQLVIHSLLFAEAM